MEEHHAVVIGAPANGGSPQLAKPVDTAWPHKLIEEDGALAGDSAALP